MTDAPGFEERRQKTVWQRLDEIDAECAKGHTRLRKSIDALEAQFDALVSEQNVLGEKVKAASEAPIDATKLMLTSRAIIGLVTTLLGGALFMGGALWSLGSKIEAQGRSTEAGLAAQAKATENAAKLQDVQMSTLRDAAADAKNTAADAKRQYELLRYEFQSLKETVIKKGK